MGSIYGKPIKCIYEIEKIQRRAARFVTSDYQNYELGSVTKLLEELGWKSLKNRREVDRLCLLKRNLIKTQPCPWTTYQSRSKELDTCTTVIISQFMHAQTFSSSVLCQERLKIGIVYHLVLWKL